jgi:hypothetical protein
MHSRMAFPNGYDFEGWVVHFFSTSKQKGDEKGVRTMDMQIFGLPIADRGSCPRPPATRFSRRQRDAARLIYRLRRNGSSDPHR